MSKATSKTWAQWLAFGLQACVPEPSKSKKPSGAGKADRMPAKKTWYIAEPYKRSYLSEFVSYKFEGTEQQVIEITKALLTANGMLDDMRADIKNDTYFNYELYGTDVCEYEDDDGNKYSKSQIEMDEEAEQDLIESLKFVDDCPPYGYIEWSQVPRDYIEDDDFEIIDDYDLFMEWR